jgi:RNAse (barnase) inhibitor barstar
MEVIKETRFHSRMDKVWDCLRPDYDILLEIVHVQDAFTQSYCVVAE